MTTLGAIKPGCRVGVPGPPLPPLPGDREPVPCMKEGLAGARELDELWLEENAALLCPWKPALPSPGGRGLFFKSFTVVLDDIGVPWCEDAGDCEGP